LSYEIQKNLNLKYVVEQQIRDDFRRDAPMNSHHTSQYKISNTEGHSEAEPGNVNNFCSSSDISSRVYTRFNK